MMQYCRCWLGRTLLSLGLGRNGFTIDRIYFRSMLRIIKKMNIFQTMCDGGEYSNR